MARGGDQEHRPSPRPWRVKLGDAEREPEPERGPHTPTQTETLSSVSAGSTADTLGPHRGQLPVREISAQASLGAARTKRPTASVIGPFPPRSRRRPDPLRTLPPRGSRRHRRRAQAGACPHQQHRSQCRLTLPRLLVATCLFAAHSCKLLCAWLTRACFCLRGRLQQTHAVERGAGCLRRCYQRSESG